MKRRTLALCVSGFHSESVSKIIQQIVAECKQNNINVLIFNALMNKSDFPLGIDINSNLVRGESEIFSLINYQKIDGLMIFGSTIFRTNTIYEIEKQCKKNNVPIININDPVNHLAHNITISNEYSMELIVEHLIKVHKLTKINFIAGVPESKESVERLNAYKKILTKYNLPIEDKRIAYGYFWKQSVECAKQFVKDGLPQAIVCANDTMAILVSDYLKNEGYRIPRDIIVTGFDGIKNADLYEPKLTTVRPKFGYSGTVALNMMDRLLKADTQVEDICVDSELIIQESCGCKRRRKQFFNFINAEYEKTEAVNLFNKQLINANIHLSDVTTIDDLLEHMFGALDIFEFKNFCLCLDEKLGKGKTNLVEAKTGFSGMPSKLNGVVPYFLPYSDNKTFSAKEFLWYDFLNTDSAEQRVFIPLYYKDHMLGYIVFEPKDYLTFEGNLFKLWVFSAAEKIGSFYLRQELESLNEKDHLTGLYNRRGMYKRFGQIYKEILPAGENLSIVCVDIDYLKTINDKFGHEGGDNAIVQCAKAMQKAFSKDAICVRTGGDEFCVLLHSEHELNVEKMIQKFTAILETYNQTSELDYEVMCSCGYFTLNASEFSSLENMQKIADERLYEVKALHHKRRRDDK